MRVCGSVGPSDRTVVGTYQRRTRVSAAYLPAEAGIRASDRLSGFPSWIKAPTAFDGACSVFDVFGADDVLMMADAGGLEPYEVVAAQAWQRVGDSMRVALDARLPASRAE